MKRAVAITVASAIAILFALVWASNRPQPQLHLDCQRIDNAGIVSSNTVVRDFWMERFHPSLRAKFHVTSTNNVSILVIETGVQIQTDSGWETFSQEPRNEVWRLQPRVVQEMFVRWPEAGTERNQRIYDRDMTQTLRAYVRYRAAIKGPLLWKIQLSDLWKNWSFANWNQTRFGGTNEFVAKEVRQIGLY